MNNNWIRPVASVVMITYNHKSYIANAIKCVLQQETKFPFELLIGDDCSTDGTREIVEDYQRRYHDIIRAINSETNTGGRLNMLNLVNASRGDYIAYCEGDDFWHDTTKLQKQVEYLANNQIYGMVHSHSRAYYVGKNKLVKNAHVLPRNLKDNDAYNELLIGKRNIWTLTVCLRRDILIDVLRECPECSESKWPMADTQLWLEISRRARVKCIHEDLATRNFLIESASQSADPKKVLKFKLAGKNLIEHYLQKYKMPNDIENMIAARVISAVMEAAFQAEDEECVDLLYAEAMARHLKVPWVFHLYTSGNRRSIYKFSVRKLHTLIQVKRKIIGRLYRLFLANY